MVYNVYLYSRVSSDAQTQGTGLRRQSDRGIQICKEQGWNLVDDSLSDVGSAYTGENMLEGALGKFITAAKQNRLKSNPLLCIEQWDRFSRQDLDSSFEAARQLLNSGVAIHVGITGGKTFTADDLKKVSGRIQMEISMEQAWEYSHNLSKRVNAAISKKLAYATEGKAVEFGYWQPRWIDFIGPKKGIGEFRKNEYAKTVRMIVDKYFEGMSMFKIAGWLNSQKIQCIGGGKKWMQGTIHALLSSEKLTGTLSIKGQKFLNYYPAIVDEKEWNILQNKLALNKDRKGGTGKEEWIANLFPNRVKCAHCGGSITTHTAKLAKGRKERYFKCMDARMDVAKCKVKLMLPVSDIEQDFFLLYLNQNPTELLGKENKDLQAKVATIEKQLKEVDAALSDAAELIGKFPVSVIEKKLATLTAQKEQLEKDREQTNKEMFGQSDAPEALVNIKKALANITEDISEFDFAADQTIEALKDLETRKKLLNLLPSLVQRITVDLENGAYSVTDRSGKTTPMRPVIEATL